MVAHKNKGTREDVQKTCKHAEQTRKHNHVAFACPVRSAFSPPQLTIPFFPFCPVCLLPLWLASGALHSVLLSLLRGVGRHNLGAFRGVKSAGLACPSVLFTGPYEVSTPGAFAGAVARALFAMPLEPKPDMSTTPPRPRSALQLQGFVFSRVNHLSAAGAERSLSSHCTPGPPVRRHVPTRHAAPGRQG